MRSYAPIRGLYLKLPLFPRLAPWATIFRPLASGLGSRVNSEPHEMSVVDIAY